MCFAIAPKSSPASPRDHPLSLLAPRLPPGSSPPQGYRGGDVTGPEGEGAPVQAVQQGAAVLPQPVQEPGGQRRGDLQELVGEDQGGHSGVEPAGVTQRGH